MKKINRIPSRFIIVLFIIIFGIFYGLFVGEERIVGDHESGVETLMFVKHRFSFQRKFENPIFKPDLELLEYLSPSELNEFVEFCSIRYGISEPVRCREVVAKERGYDLKTYDEEIKQHYERMKK